MLVFRHGLAHFTQSAQLHTNPEMLQLKDGIITNKLLVLSLIMLVHKCDFEFLTMYLLTLVFARSLK